MKAQDLRIGNIVSCKAYLSEPTKVVEIMHSGDERGNYLRLEGVPHGVWMENKGELIVEGVPLTEDVLVKLGFESNPYQDRYENKSIHIECNKLRGKTELWVEKMPHIKHVHQIQNLYHALTGEELTLKQAP